MLVVGGGDSALEAAIQLADETDAEVGICYRRPQFARCRPLTSRRSRRSGLKGRVRAFMSTEVIAVEPATVQLEGRRRGQRPFPTTS